VTIPGLIRWFKYSSGVAANAGWRIPAKRSVPEPRNRSHINPHDDRSHEAIDAGSASALTMTQESSNQDTTDGDGPATDGGVAAGEATGAEELTFSAADVRAGFLNCVPVAVGVGGYGLVFGVVAREAGLSVPTAVAMSATVLAGAAQLIAVGLWEWPIPAVAVIGTTLVVNLRYLLMGASLRPWFTRLSPDRAYLSLFFMTDENWALTIQDLREGSDRGGFLLGSGLAIWLFWVGATAVGALAGGRVGDPSTYGLEFVLTAIFLVLLVGFWDGKNTLAPWIAAAGVAVAVEAVLPGQWYILAGGIAASLAEVGTDVR
jgi:4-azaleucine resistance transporter AzlC